MRITMSIVASLVACLTLLVATTHAADAAAKGPWKVFILAGQSNMEGAGAIRGNLKRNDGKGGLEYLVKDPKTADRFKHLVEQDGEWRVRDDVFISYFDRKGGLSAGYGSSSSSIGPELQFGHVIGDNLENQVLLIKTAWGGKSLYKDFRPPSSGGDVGKYYKKMISQVRGSLANMESDFPSTKGLGYELAGLVWYQGWNDGVNPKTAVPEYEQNLVNLIHDVRSEFQTPGLPVVVGELTGPWVQAEGGWDALRKAQSAAASRSEFAGNVIYVPTHDFVRKAEDSPNVGHGHHEFGNAETYFLVGDALGKGMLKLLPTLKPEKK